MVYTSEQKAFLLESYFRNGEKVNGVWKYSIQPCLEEFREAFPEVVIVYEEFKNTLHRNVNLFRGTASTSRKEGSGRPTERTEEVIHATQEILEQDPKTSIRHLSQQVELSVGTCHKLLRKDLHVYPYRVQSVQELQPVDFPRRLQYCQWFLDNIANNNELLEKTFFTDEAWFHLSGYTNSQNMRIWATEHPHEIVEEPLHPEKIGVWAAISKRRIVGPIFFQGTLTAVRYREEILTPFIEELHDDELREGLFQQDGATAHCTAETLDFLRTFFDDRIISRNTANDYPPRSCDLTPCDFYLWPRIKNSIFVTPIPTIDELRRRIQQKINEINENPLELTNVLNSVRRRCVMCVEQQGRHFQQFL
nr:PREDICTED: uncharacterized protein LOC103314449 [Tribolium castaneum]|eukprot:XP_008198792.1 PREDICTED: uncharacterized protein LOC103314449 [Tribolium castaneum]